MSGGTASCAARSSSASETVLLRAVVQVALDSPPGRVGGGDDPSARASSSARLSVFAIAVATSSVNPASRPSVSGGTGSSFIDLRGQGTPGRPRLRRGAADERHQCRATAGLGRALRRDCDPTRPAGLEGGPGHESFEGEPPPRVDEAAAPGPAPETGSRAVRLVADESGGVAESRSERGASAWNTSTGRAPAPRCG